MKSGTGLDFLSLLASLLLGKWRGPWMPSHWGSQTIFFVFCKKNTLLKVVGDKATILGPYLLCPPVYIKARECYCKTWCALSLGYQVKLFLMIEDEPERKFVRTEEEKWRTTDLITPKRISKRVTIRVMGGFLGATL